MDLSVSDWVLLSTQILQMAAYTRKKFMPRWLGPFTIIEEMGTSYHLKLPASMKVHPVFHSSLLKRWHGPPPTEEVPDVVEGELEYKVEKVLKKRLVRGQ